MTLTFVIHFGAGIVGRLKILVDIFPPICKSARFSGPSCTEAVVYRSGRIEVNVDVFSTKTKIMGIDGIIKGVHTEKIVLRQNDASSMASIGLFLLSVHFSSADG